jgi:hypothetical protein
MTVHLLLAPRHLASSQFQQSTSDTPHISFDIIYGVNYRLGSHPVRCSFLSFASVSLVVDKGDGALKIFGTAEIADLEDSFVRQEDVGTL